MLNPRIFLSFLSLSLFLVSPAFAQPENWKLVRDKTETKLREIAGSVRGAMELPCLI